MDKKLFDVLEMVLKELQESFAGEIPVQHVIDFLEEQGFSDDEISLAMSWLLGNEDTAQNLIDKPGKSLPRPMWRSLNEDEQEAISPNAFGYLFRLRELDVLTDSMMERIIDQAVRLHTTHLDVEDMKELVTAVVLEYEDNASSGFFQFISNQNPH
ncbi:MAG: DUF494 family protein [candidate division KSB1 bacterium]|nr:DUF494 family protein [candidate division KSB1 bacterium]